MAYFVTGGTGFIGRHVIARLAARGERIHVLVRPGSSERFERLKSYCGERAGLLVPIEGDLASEALGVALDERTRLHGEIVHMFHIGALYDLTATAAALERANVAGTRHALAFAREVHAGCFHHVSSIAVAGRYAGTFREEMLAEAGELDHPYFRTKHDSEALVRASGLGAWRIYRPGMVIGDSTTGVTDKVAAPYYLFRLIQAVRDRVPSWLPLVGLEGGHVNLVPIDFVADALVHLAHLPGEDGHCFHLTDPVDRRVGAVLNIFAAAAHAPRMSLRLEPGVAAALMPGAGTLHRLRAPARRIIERFLGDLGIPGAALDLLTLPTRFDPGRTQGLLAAAGIRAPPLEAYAWRIWDYWERQLDPGAAPAVSLAAAVRGKTILVTGGSSGIGRAVATRLASAGARVLIVARDAARLAATRLEIEAAGGEVATYEADLSEAESCERFLAALRTDHRDIDILVNSAGRSIRRAIEGTYARFHDYERLMRINYFGAVRVTLGVLPGMVARGGGHVVNISSIGVLTGATRFAGYSASKAALEAFSRAAAAEYADRGVRFTVINMPLTRTPMSAPTALYRELPLLEPAQAADLVCEAIVCRPARIVGALGKLAQLVELFAPSLGRAIMSESFRMFPESEAAGGPAGASASPQGELAAFAQLLRGINW